MVMYLGKIVEIADAKTIISQPKHPYTQALISAVPQLEPGAQRSRTVLRGDLPSPIHPPGGCPFHPRCPIAEPRCAAEVPIWREFAPAHNVSCHLAR
jgi:oligopeptide/dipeptide ABC transporter ATP-binding protein